MQVVCLDLEGVLVPEIWIAFAEKTGVEGLRRTTRDEPDYQVLMDYRLRILDEHSFTLSQIQEVIDSLDPLPGAGGISGRTEGTIRSHSSFRYLPRVRLSTDEKTQSSDPLLPRVAGCL